MASLFRVELVAQVDTRKGNGTPGVFFFDAAEQICRITDLSFDFLLTIAKVVVRDQRDDDAFGRAAGEFERCAAVVEFVFRLPAHAVFTLSFRSIVVVWESDVLLAKCQQMRSQDHAAGVACPMIDIQPGVIRRQKRVASVTEDRFDKVQIANQRTRREESDLHAFFGTDALNFGADQRSKQQGDERSCWLRTGGCKRKLKHVARSVERCFEKRGECDLRDGSLVTRNRQAAFGDVECSAGRAAIVQRIMQDAILDSVRRDERCFVFRSINRQRKFASDSVTVKNDGRVGEPQRIGQVQPLEVAVEECFDPSIDRRPDFVQPLQSLVVRTQQPFGVNRLFRRERSFRMGQAHRNQFQNDISNDTFAISVSVLARTFGTDAQ